MLNFKIEKNKYDVILLNNSIQFVERNNALKFIKKLQQNIKYNGFIIISAFTEDDPTTKNVNLKNIRFKKQELLSLFKNFRIYYYFENIINDKPHIGANFNHKHGIVKIIAQKIKH